MVVPDEPPSPGREHSAESGDHPAVELESPPISVSRLEWRPRTPAGGRSQSRAAERERSERPREAGGGAAHP